MGKLRSIFETIVFVLSSIGLILVSLAIIISSLYVIASIVQAKFIAIFCIVCITLVLRSLCPRVGRPIGVREIGAKLSTVGALLISAVLFLGFLLGHYEYIDAILWFRDLDAGLPLLLPLAIGYFMFFAGLSVAEIEFRRLGIRSSARWFSGLYGALAPFLTMYVYAYESELARLYVHDLSVLNILYFIYAASVALLPAPCIGATLGPWAGFFMVIYFLYYVFLVFTPQPLIYLPSSLIEGIIFGLIGISAAAYLREPRVKRVAKVRYVPPMSSPPRQKHIRTRQTRQASVVTRTTTSTEQRLCSRYGLVKLASATGWKSVVSKCIVGRIIHGYVVESILGRGGFGIVLRAHAKVDPDDKVAIKLLVPIPGGTTTVGKTTVTRNVTEIVEELEREASNLKQLSQQSPYIVQLYAIHVDSKLLRKAISLNSIDIYLQAPPAIVMEYMAGGGLDAWRDRVWSNRETGSTSGLSEEAIRSILALGAIVAKALETVHRAGYVHSDVKPANILFTAPPPRDPSELRKEISKALRDPMNASILPKLSDLGGAVRIGEPISQFTPGYAAPDIVGYVSICGEGSVQVHQPICNKPIQALPGHDVFSLLAILFELTTGLRGGIGSFYSTWCRPDPVKKAVCDEQRIRTDLEQIYEQLYPSLPGMKDFLAPLLARLLALPSEKMPPAGRLAECLSCLADRPVSAWKSECESVCSL